MYKKLRYGLLTLLAFVGLTVNAQGVTFDFDNDYETLFPGMGLSDGSGSSAGDFTSDVTSTVVDGYTVTVSAADPEATTPNRLWNSNSYRLRVYSGTITVSGSGIETIEFEHNGNFQLSTTSQTGEFVGNLWTGNANKVEFAVKGNTQLKRIIINGEIVSVEPQEVTIAQFLAIDDSETDWYQLTGTVKNITNTSKGYFDLVDATGSSSVYVYGFATAKGGGQNGALVEKGIEEGDVLTLIGHHYTFTNSSGSKVEVTSAYFVSVEKGEVVVDDRTEKDLDHGTETSPISVAAAVDAAKVIGKDKASEGDFYVYGIISSIKYTYSASYGTATYNISADGEEKDVFTVYSSYYFDNQKWKEGQTNIEVGDEVVVCGKIINFKGKTPEFADKNSWLVLLNDWKPGALPDPVTYAVNVEEALEAAAELDKNATSYDYYKVTGYVVGTPVYKRNKDGELFGDVNLYIADEINGTPTFYIYQANNKNNELFTESDLNLFTAGDKVTFIGNLKNYVKKDKETGEEADPVYELVEGYLLNYEVSPTVTVTIPSSGLATFCPARPILVEEDQEVYIAKELQEDKVLVERVSGKIAANVGLLIKGEESVTFDVEEQGEEPEDNLLVGVLDPTDLEEGEAYILVGGAFHPCTAGTFPAGKAYLPAEAVSGAKVIVFGGETTSINEMKAQDSSREIYTIGGIRVKNAQQKGVYIINGKKVVK